MALAATSLLSREGSNPITASTLSGFTFGHRDAPKGDEWQSPGQLSLNKELPHAWFFSFGDIESARRVLPENSSLWKSLDGDWKFNWAPDPDSRPEDFFKADYDDSSWDTIHVPSNWNIVGIGKDGSQKYGTPIYVNVNVPWWKEVKPGDWRLGVMRTPPEDWTVYKTRDEVGSYRRTFEVPEEWDGKRVFINFDGVDSFFYLWVNGKYVGFSKNSRNLAQFDITGYLVQGPNSLAVEVYRFSDAANLEAQDMFRLPGIFRSVSLEAKPQVSVRDIKVTPTMTSLKVDAEIAGQEGNVPPGLSVSYGLYENKLYSDENDLVAEFPGQSVSGVLEYPDAKPWSAEAPHRYTLVGELKDASGRTLDIFSTIVGFREVCIKDTPSEEDEFN
ncbi:MAG: beta-galactosidase, partial [Bacteroidales bacterium]|nr:beta-galactosidase [Bacteroidales bacterium]